MRITHVKEDLSRSLIKRRMLILRIMRNMKGDTYYQLLLILFYIARVII